MLSQSPELAAPGSYLADLERSGLRVQQWKLDAPTLPARSDRGADTLRYTSWSDGDLGIFVTDTGPSVLSSVAGETMTDFLAIGISLSDSAMPIRPFCSLTDSGPHADPTLMGLGLGDSTSPTCHDLWIRYCRRGSRLRFRLPRVAMKGITLCVKATALHEWAGPALPHALQSALDGEEVLVQMPMAIKRERDDLLETRVAPSYASLFYRSKSSTLFWLVLDYLRRRDEEACEGKAVSDRVRSQLELVRRSLIEAPQQRLSVDEMARRAGLNRTSLRALFKQVYGMRLSEYRTAELMQRAERMLHTEHRSLIETAYALGYSGASSFGVAYKRHFGHPPGHLSMTDHDSRRVDHRFGRHNESATNS